MPKIITDRKIIKEILSRGVEHIYPGVEQLEKLLVSGKRLNIFCGYDPNAPTLHLGHGITIRKLAKFQQLGHRVIFLFGDFTGQIGDPDKLSVRQQITHKQVLANAKHWKKQIANLIDIKKVDFRYNSQWLGKMTFKDVIALAQHFTAQQMLERDMFQRRIEQDRPIYLHEFFYPLMQAYDSVAMDIDLEIGGNDQTFNMLAGRTLMRSMKDKEKLVMTAKLLTDPEGKKMGKSEGNMVMLADKPEEMYGKIMSWPDSMIIPAFEILTDISDTVLKVIKAKLVDNSVNPRDIKMQLAQEVVRIYQGEKAAQLAQERFKRVFQDHQQPTNIATVKIKAGDLDADGSIGVLDLFVRAKLVTTNSEGRRLISEHALRVGDELVVKPEHRVVVGKEPIILQRGKKHFAQVERS